jgi:hypothetical protein
MPVDCDSLQEQWRGLQITQKGGGSAFKDAKLQGMMKNVLAAPAHYAFLMQ